MSKRVEIIREGVKMAFEPFKNPLSGLDEEGVERFWKENSGALAAPVIDAWREAYQGVPDEAIPKEDVDLFMNACDSKPGGS